MPEVMQAILDDYDESLDPIYATVKSHGIGWGTFRRRLDKNPDLQAEYERIQHWRGERYSEKGIEVGTDLSVDKEHVRAREVAAQVYERAASRYNRRFNPRVTVEHDAGPNILSAMAEAQRRLPPRDLAQVIEGEYAAIPALNALDAANEQSGDAQKSSSSAGDDDPFVD